MYQKILVPLDGSDLSHEAIPHAIQLATGTGAQVVLLQVIDSVSQIIAETTPATIEPIPSGQLSVEIAESAVEGQRQAAEEILAAGAERFVEGGIARDRITAHVSEGPAAQTIVDEVANLEADVVVIASRGRSGLGRALLGSVADHVARHTPNAAVLLIRPQGKQ